ncbi:MAG: hypothetical protein IJR64_01815 [Bacteroidales bacterium]|nr:hypothetical protein [Bacteroidales bacterium]
MKHIMVDDIEKYHRIEKLRRSNPVFITGVEVEVSDDIGQYRKNAEKYAKTLRGSYINLDTGVEICLTSSRKNGGIREILEHDYKDIYHLQSVAAIPQIIKESIYITSTPNEDNKVDATQFDYYVCGLKIGCDDYTVKSVIVTLSDGRKYYDHKLSHIEKGKLLDELARISAAGQTDLSSEGAQGEAGGSSPTAGGSESKKSPLSAVKDIRLLSILQIAPLNNANMNDGSFPQVERE